MTEQLYKETGPSKVCALVTDNIMTEQLYEEVGPSKVCALVTTKSKVYKDPNGVECGLWPLRCPQRNLEFFSCEGQAGARQLYSAVQTAVNVYTECKGLFSLAQTHFGPSNMQVKQNYLFSKIYAGKVSCVNVICSEKYKSATLKKTLQYIIGQPQLKPPDETSAVAKVAIIINNSPSSLNNREGWYIAYYSLAKAELSPGLAKCFHFFQKQLIVVTIFACHLRKQWSLCLPAISITHQGCACTQLGPINQSGPLLLLSSDLWC